ncbi:hypothetical protein B2J93_8595 [Marssonina coronariae]|uniref:Uncharacterized protein n=1 Tax=Diplocarpon coronariae TaxID=2795749 RepID=A0A218YT49_9HELO|nr:hypothetical protein B2J93_8595 [Marssonina coronariae]
MTAEIEGEDPQIVAYMAGLLSLHGGQLGKTLMVGERVLVVLSGMASGELLRLGRWLFAGDLARRREWAWREV